MDNIPAPKIFDAVVLSGGGFKGLIELGVLQYHVEMGTLILDDIVEFAGTSIGAACCLLLCVGYLPKDVFHYVCFNDLFELNDDVVDKSPTKFLPIPNTTLDPFECVTAGHHTGAMSLEPFLGKLSGLVIKKLGYVPTLGELFIETGKILNVSMSNVSKKSEERLYHKTHSNLNCITAVGYSCSLPMVFHKAIHVSGHGDTNIVADGALVNNFPWDYISSECRNILGVYLGGNDDDSMFTEGSTLQYLYNLITISHTQLTHLRLDNAPENVHLVSCHWPGNIMKFKMTHVEKMKMFVYGWSCGERCYTTKRILLEGL